MNVSLTPELTGFISAKVASGRYRSASEVVRAALRLLDEQDRAVEQSQDRSNHDGQNVAFTQP
nr:type II toxin-antitoxin system ParD family antitoxin [Microvirga puerhi]